jgi:signal transduction histidine kinase
VSPQIISDSTNVFALVSGIVLLVFISVGMSFIFVYLNRQMNITKLYDNFIASVTHELKSPLSSIQLYLETINSREVPPKKQKEFIEFMLKDTGRLNNLINSILHLSGLEQKKTVRKYPHNYRIYKADSIMRELIEGAMEQFKIAKNSVTVSSAANCECVIDRSWFEIVFHNLFDNAIKYSTNSVRIDIKISSSTKKFEIEFNDNGIGILSKDQKKIFNKFQRIDNLESPSVKGTGLGLYWVSQIIKYHGGKIFVFSDGKNLGTTFKIALPIYQSSKKRHIKNLLKISRKNKEIVNENDGSNE